MINYNSYLGRGIKDYLYAKSSMLDTTRDEYNWEAIIFSQSAEKLLKAVIENKFADDSSCISLMETHNLRTIVFKILERFPDAKLSYKDCKWLGDFYFDAQYPSDDFLVVSLRDALEAMAIAETVLVEVEKILDSDYDKMLFADCKERLK